MTYADLMSLLLVLFVFLYSSRVAPGPIGPGEPPSARAPESPAWVYLGTLPSLDASAEEIAERLRGGRSRVALVGFALEHDEAFRAASEARDLLVGQEIQASRFLLVSAGQREATRDRPRVDVYSRN
jgi:hypothetical protein